VYFNECIHHALVPSPIFCFLLSDRSHLDSSDVFIYR